MNDAEKAFERFVAYPIITYVSKCNQCKLIRGRNCVAYPNGRPLKFCDCDEPDFCDCPDFVPKD